MNKLSITLIFLLCITFSACEKDDICVESDTPLLLIRFYDASNPTALKAVSSLRIIGVGNGSPIATFGDRISSIDSIGIPLRTNGALTQFTFIANSGDDENGTETGTSDVVTFSYEIKEEFVSRACGFIANYESLSSDFTATPENWIQIKTIELQ